ncbi:MAG: hypothetical protein ACRC7N_16345, partial [Clostridium sp.]
EKHFEIIRYLNRLDKKLRVLIRIPTMQNSETILKYKAKTGVSKKINKLSIYVDSLQSKSQEKTPREFNCIIVYPVESLKAFSDQNIIDVLNYRKAEKIFWVSNNDSVDLSYLKIMCDMNHEIVINNVNEDIHNRINSNLKVIESDNLEKIEVENLSYHYVESAISDKYKLGLVETSSIPAELVKGVVGSYTLGASRKTVKYIIKVPTNYSENNKYIYVKVIK